MLVVLDACAMIAFLSGENGADEVEALLRAEPPSCFAHVVNLCEVFYKFLGRKGEAAARAAIDDLTEGGLLVRDDIDTAFWKQAGRYKASCKIPLADAFVLALAERLSAEIVTTDRGDFAPLARAGICRVRFVR